jgi:membrane glycosyltransferase
LKKEPPSLDRIWERKGLWRRILLLALIAVPTVMAAQVMHSILLGQERKILAMVMTGLFAVLFGWISVGFWSSLSGALVLWLGGDACRVMKGLPQAGPLPEGFRTAILFPVYNEDAYAVAAGVGAVRRALAGRGLADNFDVFVLSDSTDPDCWASEEEAWAQNAQEEGLPRLFYRRRQINLKRKSGNIADFCRRWGADYRYMVIFDADSLMAADTLARLVAAMERRPDIGIIQTPPKAIFGATPLSRAQEFANHLYGPLFAAGLHFWQLGDAQYWGHNAIIRVEPFMRHCQLPRLKGRSALSGEILSHDFVESALMRRAGYGVWLAYDLEGSWEQTPPSLPDELIRDRRWCQGNLQHSRLIFTRGFFPTHRALFINGIMSYGSALLWFFFLLASTVEAISQIILAPSYFPEGPSLFPDWPRYFPAWALALLSSTAALLFFPKILAAAMVALSGRAKGFGGFWRMNLSILLEVAISTFLAPVRMLFHSYFVVSTLLGVRVSWNAQNRDPSGLSWGAAFSFHWAGSLLGLIWGGSLYLVSPGFFMWLSPVAAGLVLSIPLSVLTSRVSLGRALGRLGLFLTPSSTAPAEEIESLARNLSAPAPPGPAAIERGQGFMRAVVLPKALSAHLWVSRRARRNSPEKAARLKALVEKALELGPEGLSRAEKKSLLNDPESLSALHRAVWKLPQEKAALWGLSG